MQIVHQWTRSWAEGDFELYLQQGYLPHDRFHESVSNTLDYVYGDFCIAQIAKTLGKMDDYERFMARAQNYKLLFDPTVGFMRGRNEDGTWQEAFDPLEWGNPFCEGGAWQGSWAVPHDFPGLAGLMGGEEAFVQRLDQLMAEEPVFKVGSYGLEIHEMSEMSAPPIWGSLPSAISRASTFLIYLPDSVCCAKRSIGSAKPW